MHREPQLTGSSSIWRRVSPLDAGIFIISFAILFLELLLTRVFSVVMYHHFSFLAVSLAMMGIALGGLMVHLRPRIFRADNVRELGATVGVFFALTVIVASVIAFHMPVRLEPTAANWRNVIVILVMTVVPLTLGGVIVAHILAFNAERAHRLYFFDLAGAGFACMTYVPVIGLVGAPTALLITSALAALGAATLAGTRRTRRASMLLAAVLLVAAAINTQRTFFDVQFAKGGIVPPTLVSRWNSFSRVEVRGIPADLTTERSPLSWGFSSTLEARAHELHLLYDADALTQIVGFNGDLSRVGYLLYDVTAAAHHARPNTSVLVIGAGGGRDILAALAAGARNVTGVEINDITVDLMRNQFREYTGGLYTDMPGVIVHTDDGRSFLRRTDDRYDLITASLVDTWAASAAGTYALAENSLYTVEAFSDYLTRLSPHGIVSFSRWYGNPPFEVFRVITLAREALRRMGIREPRDHVVVIRTDPRETRRPSLATVLLKKSPFTSTELQRLGAWSDEMLFDIAYIPPLAGRASSQPALDTLLGHSASAAHFVARARADLSPTTDNRPFFFDRVPLVPWVAHRLGLPSPQSARESLPLASHVLLLALVATAAGTLLLLALPALLGREHSLADSRTVSRRERFAWIAYFGCLGLGYIIVEIVLIQRLNLYLGTPAYALTVVLFPMLLASGLGGLASERFDGRRFLAWLVGLVCVALVVVGVALTPIIYATIGANTAIRVALSILVIAPLAIIMGMPFPTGLRLAGRASPSIVPWAWAVNGGTSVLGSVLAVIISMSAGFSVSFMFGLGAYVIALVLVCTRLRTG